MIEEWGLGDEFKLAYLSSAEDTTDPHLLRALCATAVAMIREQKELRLRSADEVLTHPRRSPGRPRVAAAARAERPVGRPRKYSERVVDAFGELQLELGAFGKPHSDRDTARALLERYDIRERPYTRAQIRGNECFIRRLAKYMSARRNSRPKIVE